MRFYDVEGVLFDLCIHGARIKIDRESCGPLGLANELQRNRS